MFWSEEAAGCCSQTCLWINSGAQGAVGPEPEPGGRRVAAGTPFFDPHPLVPPPTLVPARRPQALCAGRKRGQIFWLFPANTQLQKNNNNKTPRSHLTAARGVLAHKQGARGDGAGPSVGMDAGPCLACARARDVARGDFAPGAVFAGTPRRCFAIHAESPGQHTVPIPVAVPVCVSPQLKPHSRGICFFFFILALSNKIKRQLGLRGVLDPVP